MKQRKNGFTLIELLAVIVILAIIALIATPIILNIIEKAKKSAFMDSAYGLVEAAKLEYTEGLLQNMTMAKSYTFPQVGKDQLKFSGSEPTGGTINVSGSGQISLALYDGTWCITKGRDDSEVKISKYEDGACVLPPEESTNLFPPVVYFNPELKEMCQASEAVSIPGTKTGCMKWYVYKDNGDGTQQLILDHNTTAGLENWYTKDTVLSNDTATWDRSLNARLITADEIADIVGASSEDTIKWSSSKLSTPSDNGIINIDIASRWFYFDGGSNSNPTVYEEANNGWQKQYAISKGMSHYAWLFDYTNGCAEYGCNIEDSQSSGYWTSTTSSIYTGYSVDAMGCLEGNYIYSSDSGYDVTIGIRPVITL